MQIILVDDVYNLGTIGDLVNVRPGYARNYLLPNGKAILASATSKRRLEHDKRTAGFRLQKVRAEAESAAGKLKGVSVTIARKVGEQDKLFGSVTTMDIEKALAAQGITIDRKKMHLAEPIKSVGEHAVTIKLGGDVNSTIKVAVVADTAEG